MAKNSKKKSVRKTAKKPAKKMKKPAKKPVKKSAKRSAAKKKAAKKPARTERAKAPERPFEDERAYDFSAIEARYQKAWEDEQVFFADMRSGKPPYYVLDMFPYPSGQGLHVGHPRGYLATDALARVKKMQGHEVLHPMGWDAFGLPSENYAIKTGVPPAETTKKNIVTYKRQLTSMGMAYDWSKEINTSDPAYYRWTQWIFLLLYKRGLAYKADGLQWWCTSCKTVLANEQVEQGKCFRCDTVVTKKALSQWFFKITAYADRLLANLDALAWPEKIKSLQRNWIGRSEGAEITFGVADSSASITVFTTRPDTLPGVTFLVVAPESEYARTLPTADARAAVEEYAAAARRMSDIDRQKEDRPKTGANTGAFALHPLTGERLPIYVADYVLAGYGTGAIMAVPGHDTRDYAFAQAFDLPITQVVAPADGCDSELPYLVPGIAMNAGAYSGLPTKEAAAAVLRDLAAKQQGGPKVQFKIRDWLISRQRYWGAPIPIVTCAQCGIVPVPEHQLPVLLPEIPEFRPSGDGRGPLATLRDWVETTCPTCGGPAERETDTMDGYACSSWYFLRYLDPKNAEQLCDPELAKKWLPVSLYIGGAEHAVLHLLYVRFWTMVLHDAGMLPFEEPFAQYMSLGMILGENGEKMSKSRGNVVNPDDIVARYGADTLRCYEYFIGPFDQEIAWSDRAVTGVHRFLRRVHELAGTPRVSVDPAREARRHRLIARIQRDLDRFHFNTIIAALMEQVNAMADEPDVYEPELETLTLLLAPFAPHLAEELWRVELGRTESVFRAAWPVADSTLLATEEVEIPVQVNGKHRATLTVPRDTPADALLALAQGDANVARHLEGMRIVKVIPVPNRLLNIVVVPAAGHAE